MPEFTPDDYDKIAGFVSQPANTDVGVVPDLLGNVARGVGTGLMLPIQQLNSLAGDRDEAARTQAVRESLARSEAGDLLPTNPNLAQSLPSIYARSVGQTIPMAALFSVNAPLAVGAQTLSTQQSLDDAAAQRQAMIDAGETPPEEQNALWEHAKGLATLYGFSKASQLAQPVLRPLIASTPSLLRPAVGVAGHTLSNFGIDAAIRTGEHALAGQPLAPFASKEEAAEAAGAATSFAFPGGIHQAVAQTKLINKIQPTIAQGGVVPASMMKASGLRVPENYTLEENKTTGDFYRPKTEAELILPNATKTAAELAAKPTQSPEAEAAAKEAEAALAQETVQPPQAGEVPPAPAVEPVYPYGHPLNPVRTVDLQAAVVPPAAAPILNREAIRDMPPGPERDAQVKLWIAENEARQARGEQPIPLETTEETLAKVRARAEVPPTGEVPPVTTEARAKAEVAGETAKATEAAKQKTAEERIAEIDKEMDALVERHGFNEETGELNDTNPADKKRYDAISKERVALFNGDESSLGKTPVAETGDTGVPPPVAETAQRGAGVSGDEGVSGERGAPAVPQDLTGQGGRQAVETRGGAQTVPQNASPSGIRLPPVGRAGVRASGPVDQGAASGVRGELGETAGAGKKSLFQAERTVGDQKPGPKIGEFLTSNEGTARTLTGPEGTVKRVSAEIKNPLSIADEHLDSDGINAALKKAGVKFQFPKGAEQETWRWIDEGGKKFVDAMRKAGYDAAQFPEFLGGKDQTTTLLFDHKKSGDTYRSNAKVKPNEEVQEPVSTTPDNAGTNVQGEQGTGPRPDAGVAAGVQSGAANGEAPRSALSPKETAELAANKAEQVAIFKQRKQSKADEARIEELQARADELEAKGGLPAKTIGNVDGSEKSSAADLVRTGAANGHDLLSKIAESNSPFAELVRHLAERFKPLLTRLGVDHNNTANAQYDPQTHRVLIGERRNGDVDIVHEIVHGITANTVFRAVQRLFPQLGNASGDTYIDAMRKTAKASGTERPVKDIINQYLHYLDTLPEEQRNAIVGKDGLANRPGEWRKSKHPFQYGAVSVQEFIAEAFTDPQFRRDLNSMKAPGGGTIWSKMFDAVRRLLGADVNQKSLLAAVLDTSGKLGDLNESNAKGEYGLLPAKSIAKEGTPERLEQLRQQYEDASRKSNSLNDEKTPSANRANRAASTRAIAKLHDEFYRQYEGERTPHGQEFADFLRKSQDIESAKSGSREAPIPAKRIENESPLARPEEEGKDRIPEGFTENRLGTTYQDVPSTNEGRTVRFGGPAGEVRGAGGEAQQGAALRSGDNAGGARVGEAPLPTKQVEEEINPGFYSKLGETISRKMPATADVATIKGIIANGGLKAEELKWSGIIPWLESQKGKVTKDQVQDYLRNEGAVRFEEKVLGNSETWSGDHDKAQNAFEKVGIDFTVTDEGTPFYYNKNGDAIEREDMNARQKAVYDQFIKPMGATKFNRPDLVLPGGENYREVVLTVPQGSTRELQGRMNEIIAQARKEGKDVPVKGDSNYEEYERIHQQMDRIQDQPTFTSSHFPESGNYVAHMRINERPDSTGKKGTFIEEIQSDRHQKGREQGYTGEKDKYGMPEGYKLIDENEEARKAGYNVPESAAPQFKYQGPDIYSRIFPSREEAIADANKRFGRDTQTIPDAPYRKDWGVQMFKRALRDAIAKGQDWVGWTRGDTQAERYDLSKQLSEVNITKTSAGDYNVTASDKQGGQVVRKFGISESELADTIGKDLATKAIAQEPNASASYTGLDLKVGGEGMKGFYDTILPNEVGKYVKQWGGKVEEGSIAEKHPTKGTVRFGTNGRDVVEFLPPDRMEVVSTHENLPAAIKEAARLNGEQDGTPFHKVAITPEMRASVKGVGQPLFAKHIEEAPTPAVSRASFKDKLTEALKGNKYGARLLRRLAPGVHDVEDTITRTIDEKDATSARAAGMVRDTLTRELPDKKDHAPAYIVLDNGGGRANDADSSAAENLAFHRLQEQRAFLEENLAKATKGPQAQEIQDKIASIEENMARLQEPAPTVDEVKARIQTEIDKGQAALESEEVPEERKKVIRENLPHYQRAYDNAERLVPAAKLAKRAYDDAYLLRQSVDPTGAYYQDYAGRLYEYNETRGGAQVPPDSLIGGRSGIQRYNKQRSYDTLMDAMIGRENSEGTWEGETPLSLALPDVVANHVKNSNDFVGNETVKDDLSLVRDPQTNEPILLPKLKPGQEHPANYVKVIGPSGEDTWVYKPFADIFRTVWSPDATVNSDIGRVSLKAAGVLKHGTVAYDVFHPSRLTQIGAFEALAQGKVFDITGRASRLKDYYNEVVRPAFNGDTGPMGKFLAQFNVDARDIDRYLEKGIITKETADYLRGEGKVDMQQMKEGGLRPQLFVDNLWKEAEPFLRKMFSKVHGEVLVDAQMKLNKMTFERLAPAMMAAVFKWRRADIARQNPEMSSVQVSRQAAKETNERFGNMGKSGPLKSATANSLAQRIALAPHWVISQAMSEARGVAQLGKAVLDATWGRKMPDGKRERVFRLGNSAKFLATTMGTVFAMNQLVNMATRGHPTWQNPEDDHKFDAWIPGGKTGFFYSPTTLAAEYSHHFHNYHKFESTGSAIAHIATNKLSPMGQAAKIALTQKNYKGEKLSTLGTVGEVTKALTPIPISVGSAVQPLNPLASPSKSGQLTNNLARTFGVQLDRAPDAVAQAYESFKKYRTKERPDMGPSPYRDLKTLVQNEASPKDIKAEVDRLMKDGKKMQDIKQSFSAQFHPSGSVIGDINALQSEGPKLTPILTAARKQKAAEREYFMRAMQSK